MDLPKRQPFSMAQVIWLIWKTTALSMGCVSVFPCWVDGPHGIMCQYWACHSIEEPSAMKFKRIAVETSKSVFTLHGVDEQGRPTLRQNLSRAQFGEFVGKVSPTEVVLEACGSP